MDNPTTDRRFGPFIMGLVVGALASTLIWVISRADYRTADQVLRVAEIFDWRVTNIIQAFVGLAAAVFAIRGDFRKTAWLGLAYFLFEIPMQILRSLVYWP